MATTPTYQVIIVTSGNLLWICIAYYFCLLVIVEKYLSLIYLNFYASVWILQLSVRKQVELKSLVNFLVKESIDLDKVRTILDSNGRELRLVSFSQAVRGF